MLNSSDYAKNYASTIGKSLSWSQLQELQVQTHNVTISFVALFFIVTSNEFYVTALLCPWASLSSAAYAFRVTWLRANLMIEKAWKYARQELGT